MKLQAQTRLGPVTIGRDLPEQIKAIRAFRFKRFDSLAAKIKSPKTPFDDCVKSFDGTNAVAQDIHRMETAICDVCVGVEDLAKSLRDAVTWLKTGSDYSNGAWAPYLPQSVVESVAYMAENSKAHPTETREAVETLTAMAKELDSIAQNIAAASLKSIALVDALVKRASHLLSKRNETHLDSQALIHMNHPEHGLMTHLKKTEDELLKARKEGNQERIDELHAKYNLIRDKLAGAQVAHNEKVAQQQAITKSLAQEAYELFRKQAGRDGGNFEKFLEVQK